MPEAQAPAREPAQERGRSAAWPSWPTAFCGPVRQGQGAAPAAAARRQEVSERVQRELLRVREREISERFLETVRELSSAETAHPSFPFSFRKRRPTWRARRWNRWNPSL